MRIHTATPRGRCAPEQAGRLCLGIGLASCFALFPAAEPARAWVLDGQTAVNLAGTKTYADATRLVELPLFDISPSIPLGAVGCVGACIGLTAQVSGHADIDARFAVGYQSFIDLAAKASARTFIFGQGQAPFVGDPPLVAPLTESRFASVEFSVPAPSVLALLALACALLCRSRRRGRVAARASAYLGTP